MRVRDLFDFLSSSHGIIVWMIRVAILVVGVLTTSFEISNYYLSQFNNLTSHYNRKWQTIWLQIDARQIEWFVATKKIRLFTMLTAWTPILCCVSLQSKEAGLLLLTRQFHGTTNNLWHKHAGVKCFWWLFEHGLHIASKWRSQRTIVCVYPEILGILLLI